MLAPVVALATGACFATTKDVIQLQGDVMSTRDTLQRRIARLEQQQAMRFDSLSRHLNVMLDSLRVFQNQFYSTGGNLTDNQQALQRLLDRTLGQFEALLTEQQNQRKALDLLSESVRGIQVALANDTNRTAPEEGPLAKIAAAEQMMLRSPSSAREILENLISSMPPPDSVYLATAYHRIAESYKAQDKLPEADSVYHIVYEKFPQSPEAPTAMYNDGLILEQLNKRADARAVYQRLKTAYPGSSEFALADERLRNMPPPLHF